LAVILGSRNVEWRWKDAEKLTIYAEHLLEEKMER
jgi:hypothetical protein